MYNQNDWNALMVKTSFETYKLQERARIETDKTSEIAKKRADIVSQRELQQMRVVIEESGAVSILKETFAGNILKPLPIEMVQNKLLVPIGIPDEEAVLHIIVKRETQQQAIWLTREGFVCKKLNESFQRAGIRFGFDDKKEKEIQKLFIVAAANVAEISEIPIKHGWYWNGAQYCYAGPEVLVWKEALRNAKQ